MSLEYESGHVYVSGHVFYPIGCPESRTYKCLYCGEIRQGNLAISVFLGNKLIYLHYHHCHQVNNKLICCICEEECK